MKLLLLLLSAISSTVVGYKVLVISTTPSRSHSTLAKGIVDSLLNAGHDVTWVSPFTDWKPHQKLRVIGCSETIKLAEGIDMTRGETNSLSIVKEFAKNISALTINNAELRETLVKEDFDAVVSEWFFSDTDAGYAAVQQVPWIMLSPTPMMPGIEGLVDDTRSVSTIPMMMHDYGIPMSFMERMVNTVTFAMMWIGMQLEMPSTEARYESFFADIANARGVTLPPFKAALYNVSILLVNSHPSIAPALSQPPNVLDIAGYHIPGASPLPKDIQQVLDSSPQGVVYFSMGSVVKSSVLPLSLRKELIAILGAIPYTVLWKFEEDLEGLPKNIVIRKWWPQSSVLAHPNVRLFITHGGMLSTTEAVHYGVPLLAVPVFGDQPNNAARAVRAGYALSVPYSDTMAPQLKQALSEMLNNDSYYKQAKYLSKIFNKRPVHPSKLISHYIELAIESKGAYHLRSKTHLYAWYQRWFLDQLAVLLALLYALYTAVVRLCKRRNKSIKKAKRN